MNRALIVLLFVTITACSDITGPDDGGWSFNEGTDNISGRPYASATLSDTFAGMKLIVRCRERAFDVYVTTNFIVDDAPVRFRIDSGSQRTQTWTEATDYKGLFYRGDARAFARELANSKEMVIEVREFVGGATTATFRLPGLSVHLPKIEATCV